MFSFKKHFFLALYEREREYKKQTLLTSLLSSEISSLAKREREREKRNDAPSVYHHRLGRRSKSSFERMEVIARGQKLFFSRGYKTRPRVVLLLFFFFFESVVVSTNSSRESLRRCFFVFVRRWQPKESDGRDTQKRGEAVLFGDSWSSQSAGFRDAGETPGRRGVADEILRAVSRRRRVATRRETGESALRAG